MKHYRDIDGQVWAFADDGSQDEYITETMVAMTTGEVALHLNPPPSLEQLIAAEDQWREDQMTRIAKQLLMIEDDNPKAEPGTARQWRQYRIAVMDWVHRENPDFPYEDKRPVAPE